MRSLSRRPTAGNERNDMTQLAVTHPVRVDTIIGDTILGNSDPTGEVAVVAPTRRRQLARTVARWFEPASLVPTYVGVVVAAVGFAIIGLTWADVAVLRNVAQQTPYLVSGGITGLGLVMVGLIFVNVSAKRQDGAERSRQLQTLTETMQAVLKQISRLDVDCGESVDGEQ